MNRFDPADHKVATYSLDTPRLRTRVLEAGARSAPPVVLIHGNVSSARFFTNIMGELARRWRVLAFDMRGFGGSEAGPVDATRGLRDFSDDLEACLGALDVLGSPLRLLGWSMGAGVALQYAIDHPGRVASLVLESPMSPFGFGGTKDQRGTPCWEDFAGSGGGTANTDLVRRIVEQDRGDDGPTAPRNVLTQLYIKPANVLAPDEVEVLVGEILTTVIGEANYPGDAVSSANWPFLAPGVLGVLNAISPRYCDLSAFSELPDHPEVLWIRGSDDQIVSDQSMSDLGHLGELGLVPGWPGASTFPAQPMVAQMRHLLERHRANGGNYHELVLPDCGHSPHLERPAAFIAAVLDFLAAAPRFRG